MVLRFRKLPEKYAVCRLPADAPLPEWASRGALISITRTEDELSLVCPVDNVPRDLDPGMPWACLQLQGPFPFTETGVLLSFVRPLSEAGVPVFAISTYDTDYVLVPETEAERAAALLQEAGHEALDGSAAPKHPAG